MAEVKYASLDVADMKEGSNLFDNVQGKIAAAKYTNTPPSDSYTVEGNPIFMDLGLLLDGDGPEEERRVSQSYSLGASAGEHFTISEDGNGLVAVLDGDNEPTGTLRKDSKFGTLMASLKEVGVSPAILKSGDLSKFVGIHGKWKRIADKERSFGDDKKNSRKSKFPPTTLVCVKLVDGTAVVGAPAGKTAAATVANTNGTAATQASTAPAADFDLDTETGIALTEIIAAKGGKVQRSQLTLLLSQARMKHPARQDIARRGSEEAFLNTLTEMGVVKYDGTAKPQVVLAAA